MWTAIQWRSLGYYNPTAYSPQQFSEAYIWSPVQFYIIRSMMFSLFCVALLIITLDESIIIGCIPLHCQSVVMSKQADFKEHLLDSKLSIKNLVIITVLTYLIVLSCIVLNLLLHIASKIVFSRAITCLAHMWRRNLHISWYSQF